MDRLHALGAAMFITAVLTSGVVVATALTTEEPGEKINASENGSENVHGFEDAPECWPYGCGDTEAQRRASDDQIDPCEDNASERCEWEGETR